jgi:hypothetical protein
MNNRFPMTIELSFDVAYWKNKSCMTDQQIADYVVSQVETERNELVMEAKVILLQVLDGELPAWSEGLAQEPGANACQALGPAPLRPEDSKPPKVGWFARVAGFIPRKRKVT